MSSTVFDILKEDHSPYFQNLPSFPGYLTPHKPPINRVRIRSREFNEFSATLCPSFMICRRARRQKSAKVIQHFFQRVRDQNKYRKIKNKLYELAQYCAMNSSSYLRSVNHPSAVKYPHGALVTFKLAGKQFPPRIVYKVTNHNATFNGRRSKIFPIWFPVPENYAIPKTADHIRINYGKISEILQICDSYLNRTEIASRTIGNFFLSIRNRKLYRKQRDKIRYLERMDPVKFLRLVDNIHWNFFDRRNNCLIFKLDGLEFPPKIVYRIITEQQVMSFDTHADFDRRNTVATHWFCYEFYSCQTCKRVVKSDLNLKAMKSASDGADIAAKKRKRRRGLKGFSWFKEIYKFKEGLSKE